MAAYNTFTYNTHRYNTDILYIALSESITGTSADVEDVLLSQLDFIFMDESIAVSITNIPMSDTIRLADWLSIERDTTNSEWYD